MLYDKYTVRQLRDALFDNDRSVMSEEQFNIVYSEYVDTSGLYDAEEFSKVSYIHYLSNRINSIKLAIKLQRDFFNNFDIPFVNELKFFKKFGHNVYWDAKNPQKFLDQLKMIEKREERYNDELENKIDELVKSRLKKSKKEVTEKQSRESFIRNFNSLGKAGYIIDKDKTTVEEYALMIKQQTEEINKYSK